MAGELLTDAGRMLGCGLTVAAGVGPLGAAAWWLARRAGTPVLPRPRPWRVRWSGVEVALAFLGLSAVVPVLVLAALDNSGLFPAVYGPGADPSSSRPSFEAAAAVAGTAAAQTHHVEWPVVRGLWAGLLSLPLQLAVLVAAGRLAGLSPRGTAPPAVLPARVALAATAWAVLTPVVLTVHAAVTAVFAGLDWQTDDHPLSKLSAGRPAVDHVLFFLQAGVAAPVVEEVLFRLVLLGWLVSGRSSFDPPRRGGPLPSPDRRVWVVLILGVLLAAATARGPGEVVAGVGRGPVLFAAGLLGGWVVVRRVVRKRRTAGGVYASAALFATVHSAVWPSPIPLFGLGLGLGWLAARTRGVVAPAVVHGLFNTVSVLFVLRSG